MSSPLLQLGLIELKRVIGKSNDWHCCSLWVGPFETAMRSIQIITLLVHILILFVIFILLINAPIFIFLCWWPGGSSPETSWHYFLLLSVLWITLVKVLAQQLHHEALCFSYCLHCCCWPSSTKLFILHLGGRGLFHREPPESNSGFLSKARLLLLFYGVSYCPIGPT